MPKTRGGSVLAPQSSHRAVLVRAPLDAPPHLPDSTLQRRYHTRRAAATPVPLLRFQLGVLQRRPNFRARRVLQSSSRFTSQPPPTRRPILTSSPIEGNFDCRARAFHDEAYFDHYVLRQQPELGIHTAYLRVPILYPL
ncbi:hypothetical protein CK203_090652 [Vitis vinifera]|uniref:Uncharacterized protein n=1 Tax=Vitis vinifera TaxID=29760 RepID=A0A438DVU1_VITVI|nr:hypothetical protein CK203_090652 [Vitis vinifera]